MADIFVTPQALQSYALNGADIRHQIHAHPEEGLQLTHTQDTIVKSLKSFGCEDIHTQVGGPDVAGVVAVIKGAKEGRTIGLRADSDALPLVEKTGKPYASQIEGCMHACGHDGHVATLLTVCHYLMDHRDFAGTVVAIFQPGEEGYAGAHHMLDDGLTDRFGIDEYYALHSEPMVPLGQVGFISGFATANADCFEVRFKGTGGHGSRPQLVQDSIVAMGEAISAIQTIASRNCSPDKACVVSVCYVKAGDAKGSSVIPQEAVFGGTTRSYEPEVRALIEKRIGEICQGVGMAHGVEVDYRYNKLYPSMYNTPERVTEAKRLAKLALGESNVLDLERKPGGEDFSFMLQARPGCLFRLGLGDPEHQDALHSSTFDFNDKGIAYGAAVLLTVALNRACAKDES